MCVLVAQMLNSSNNSVDGRVIGARFRDYFLMVSRFVI